jgi:flagellar basal-body rod modification protein FlgD
MTSVTSTNAALADATTSGAASKLNADFDMFLKLLTTQMQNQDPLDPMDTSEYTQQLVQYSAVEQSIEQTSTLKSILASLGTQNLTQASSLLGKVVETDSATAGLTAQVPAQWSWEGDRSVATMTATIKDSAGKIVDTRTVTTDGASGVLQWDGLTSGGRQMGPGSYTIGLVGKDSSGTEIKVTPRAVGTVTDVQLANGNVNLTINGAQVPTSALVRIGS